jgi:TRAP-type C4-dicarboxylate transport system permease small subunit
VADFKSVRIGKKDVEKMIKIFIDEFEEIICVIFTTIMSLSVTFGVISRIIGTPLAWTGEVARYSFIWAVMLGAVVATKRNGHIVIDVFLNIFPKRVQKKLTMISSIIMVILLAIIAYFGFNLSVEFWDTPMALLPYSMGIVYSSLPFGSIFMIIRLSQGVYRQFRGSNSKKEALVQ